MTALSSGVYAVWYVAVTIVVGLAGLAWPRRDWRSTTAIARVWIRLLLGGLRVICGVRWEVSGREHLPASGPALIASMHQSPFDTFVWALIAREFTYVMKAELLRTPIVGPLLRRAGMIAVDRSAGAAALRGLLRAADRALADGRQIVIFPEGTRVAPGVVAPLQPGVAALAARTGLPVIPVVTDSGRFWDRRSMRRSPGTIHVAIQTPLPPGLPREDLMARLAATFAVADDLIGSVDKCVGRPEHHDGS